MNDDENLAFAILETSKTREQLESRLMDNIHNTVVHHAYVKAVGHTPPMSAMSSQLIAEIVDARFPVSRSTDT